MSRRTSCEEGSEKWKALALHYGDRMFVFAPLFDGLGNPLSSSLLNI